jgi:hypothetical protein
MFDKFNKSIISKHAGGGNSGGQNKGDKSAMIMDRSGFGVLS